MTKSRKPWPDEEKAKAALISLIAADIWGKSQRVVARRIGMSQPKVSALVHQKTRGFSLWKLMTILAKLGYDVTIQVSATTSPSGRGKMRVRGWGREEES